VIARFGEQVYYLQTKTAPVLETPRRAGLRIIRRLVTAGRSRHDGIPFRHTRGLVVGNQRKNDSFYDFLLLALSIGFARSSMERCCHD